MTTSGFGSRLLYSSATGLEKALADVDADRLLNINAEEIIAQWDPWEISKENLPFLAWAMGVNLWPADFWSEDEKRAWVARQWYLKSIRGTKAGIREFVWAMHGELRRVIAPPATAYAGPNYTQEERAAYVAMFPQLRLYPYVARTQLPWSCFLVGLPSVLTSEGLRKTHSKNGSFMPLFWPTNADAGGRYTRTATLYEPNDGSETTLTYRNIIQVPQPPETVREYDEVILPGRHDNKYYSGQAGKYPVTHSLSLQAKSAYRIFLGIYDATDDRLVRIPRDGSLTVNLPKAQYTTLAPSANFINIYPDHKAINHTVGIQPTDWTNRMQRFSLFAKRHELLYKKYLPPTVSWQYLYECWYIFDPDRVPPSRRRNLFLDNQWFGIPSYTAKVKVKIFSTRNKMHFWTHVHGFWKPADTTMIERVREAVNASRALRDTVLIDTKSMRQIQVRDVLRADGRYSVGQWKWD